MLAGSLLGLATVWLVYRYHQLGASGRLDSKIRSILLIWGPIWKNNCQLKDPDPKLLHFAAIQALGYVTNQNCSVADPSL